MKKGRHLLAVVSLLPMLSFANEKGGSVVEADLSKTLIIKYQNDEAGSNKSQLMSYEESKKNIQAISNKLGVEASFVKKMSKDSQLIRVKGDAQKAAKLLSQQSDIEYASVNYKRYLKFTTNDPLITKAYRGAWGLWSPAYANDFASRNSSNELVSTPDGNNEQFLAAGNFENAWDLVTGDSSIVVAVVDSGVLNHNDLDDALLPGYDFIDVDGDNTHNDGDGRDSDATDPGNVIEPGTPCVGSECEKSSWHGTHVAGIVAAEGNNAQGIAGGAWGARILPVRALGVGGGYDSDIIDGVRWAAGMSVPGVPDNPNPAKVINLSIGGTSACTAAWQSAINDVTALGVTLVIAAGNEDMPVANSSPANCNDVITVGAVDFGGDRASYSNYDDGTAIVDVVAPGGELLRILSTGDEGEYAPLNDNKYIFSAGTSMATPFVSAAAALILSENPNITPVSVEKIIGDSARSNFVTSTSLYTSAILGNYKCEVSSVLADFGCGQGYLDAFEAVKLAEKAPVMASISDKSTNDEADLIFSVAAVSPEGRSLTYRIMKNDAQYGNAIVGSSSGQVNFTPKVGVAGTTVLFVAVSDGVYESFQKVNIAISQTSTIISFALDSISKSVENNKTLSFTVSATADDASAISYSVDPVDSGLVSINAATGLLVYKPNSNFIGTEILKVMATSGEVTKTRNYIVSVSSPNSSEDPSSGNTSPGLSASSGGGGSLPIFFALISFILLSIKRRKYN